MSEGFRIYRYRWVVLSAFMFVNLTIQILWISFAPITGPAAQYYGVGDLQIGLFSMVFMIAFIPLSIPVSWLIDSRGFRFAVGLGVVLMGVFGLLRGLAGPSYALALAGSIGIAIAQPFLLNAWSTVPAKWFPRRERATAVGLVTISNLAGTALGMILPPLLATIMTIATMQFLFGAFAALSSIVFLALARERPPSSPGPAGEEERALVLDGLKGALTTPSFWIFLILAFIGMGVFNGLNTWIEAILRPRGFDPAFAGDIGALTLGGGLVGAIVLSMFSDRTGRRRDFLFLSMAGAIPGLAGLTFGHSEILLAISAFVLGFFLVSLMPIGLQYAAEITAPAPEGTSNGLVQLFGQGAFVFVYLMEALRAKDGSFTPSLVLAMGLLAIGALATRIMGDSKRVAKADGTATVTVTAGGRRE